MMRESERERESVELVQCVAKFDKIRQNLDRIWSKNTIKLLPEYFSSMFGVCSARLSRDRRGGE